MGILRQLFGRPAEPPAPLTEHAVLVYLRLSDNAFGTEAERDAIHRLSDRLEQAIKTAAVGEFDGDEFGEGECTLFMYGPDADALWSAIAAPLRTAPQARGGRVIKRYGRAGDPAAREERIQL